MKGDNLLNRNRLPLLNTPVQGVADPPPLDDSSHL